MFNTITEAARLEGHFGYSDLLFGNRSKIAFPDKMFCKAIVGFSRGEYHFRGVNGLRTLIHNHNADKICEQTALGARKSDAGGLSPVKEL